MLYFSETEQPNTTRPSEDRELVPNDIVEQPSAESLISDNLDTSNLVKDSSEFFTMMVGDQFRLIGQDDESEKQLDVIVSSLDEQPKYTQIHGKIIGGGIAIVTVGGGLTNIFVKTDTGIFEFAGPDFNGKVPRLKDVNWGDDVYRPPVPKVRRPEEPASGIQLEEP